MIAAPDAGDRFAVFGTSAVLIVNPASALPAARALVDRELAAVDLACSRFRPDSEVAKLNASRGAEVQVSELLADAIWAALRAARLTGGDVDPTCGAALVSLGYDRDFALVSKGVRMIGAPVPAGGWQRIGFDRARAAVRLPEGVILDLGATAKAWAADRCGGLVSQQLGCGVLIGLGGDVAAAGPPPSGGWRVRVTDDHAAGPDAPGQTVAISSGGLATSSVTVRAWQRNGQQVHHIVRPATGRPAGSCWQTVSVAAATCLDANIASTAAIVRGEAAHAWLSALRLPARLVGRDGSVATTQGWPGPTSGAAPRGDA
ncbi:MAG TPA: FAD:protein FMN transferase [Streptosporangiaceae bacterium]|nr:FAD:protein FMN transferase [Streptosporangiaceae bacterium]